VLRGIYTDFSGEIQMSSTLVKLAVGALLAMPVAPLLARTPSLVPATYNTGTSRLSTTKHHARRYHHRSHRHHTLAARTHKTHSLSHRRHLVSMSAKAPITTSVRPEIHLTHTPPTIDGIGA
jgi:hypothetical protein